MASRRDERPACATTCSGTCSRPSGLAVLDERLGALAGRLAAGDERAARARDPAHAADVDPPGAAPALAGRDAPARAVLAPRRALGPRDPRRDRAEAAPVARAARASSWAAGAPRSRRRSSASTTSGQLRAPPGRHLAAARATPPDELARRSTGSARRRWRVPRLRRNAGRGRLPLRDLRRRPGPETQASLERQLLDLRHGEYVDAEPERWLVWHGRGIYGRTLYACGEHRGELKAIVRELYGTLGWHPWARGPTPGRAGAGPTARASCSERLPAGFAALALAPSGARGSRDSSPSEISSRCDVLRDRPTPASRRRPRCPPRDLPCRRAVASPAGSPRPRHVLAFRP